VDHGLADSKIAGCDALVEGSNASLCVDPLDALPYGHLHLGVVVQLHPCLHKPNGICGRGGDETSTRCTHYVHQWRVRFNKAGDQIKKLIGQFKNSFIGVSQKYLTIYGRLIKSVYSSY